MSVSPKAPLPCRSSAAGLSLLRSALASPLLSRAVRLVVLGCCLLAAGAQAQILFHDDLEAGTGNWSVYSYPGAPVCTPLTYASTATDPHANHTPGGAFGFKFTQASDREVHDLDLSSYGTTGLHLSLWYYDALSMRYGDFESFDLRSPNNSQILGFATRDYADHPDYYWCRVLGVTGKDPTGGTGYRVTSIQRTLGWHYLEIYQYRDPAHLNTAEFFIDGTLALRESDVVDTSLSRVVLGLGWDGNPSQTGYVDDITVQAVPEPGVAALALAGAAAALLLRRQSQLR